MAMPSVLPAARLGPDLDLPAQPTLGPWGRALHTAIARHDLEAVHHALGRGADPSAMIPFEIETLDSGALAVHGGGNALHAAVVATADDGDEELVDHGVSLPLLTLLLNAGVDVNATTLPLPEAWSVLDLLLIQAPSNVVEAAALLIQRGATPTALSVDVATSVVLPETPALLDVLYAQADAAQRTLLNRSQGLAQLTRAKLTEEGLACVACLVRQGANLDKPVRSPKGQALPSPAQAIVQLNPEQGAAQLAQLRAMAPPAAVVSITPRRRRAS